MALEILIQEYIGEETAESGTTTTNICITGHGLAAGDHIINATRNSTPPAFDNIASRRVTSVVDANNITVHTITGQTTGDTIKLFKHINRADKLMAGSLQINRQSDNNHTCTMTLVSTTAYAPRVGQDVLIKNNDAVIFGGVIKTVRRHLSPGSDTIFYDVFSDGYSSIPARRTVTNTHDNKTAGWLVEYYVDTVLYQEGVTKGTIDTGATLAEYDAVCKSIKEIFDELASASGYKWYIDDNKALHFLQDDMVSDAPHDLDNDTFKDFGNVEYEETLDNYRNKQYIRGALGDEGYVIQHESVNGAEVAVRQEIEGTSGYYGAVLNDNNIDNDTDAETSGDNLIKRYGQCLPNVITFETSALDFAPNTKLKVELTDLGIAESYYYIENVSIYDLDGKHLWASVRAVQRLSTNFSTQKGQDFIGYFSKLTEMAKKTGGASGAVQDNDGNLYTVQIYVQDDAPAAAKSKAIWIDTNDYSRYDTETIDTTSVLTIGGTEVIFASNAITLTLFTAVGNAGVIRIIKNIGSETVTIDGNNAETIDGSITKDLTAGQFCVIISDGANWQVIG